MHSFLFRVLGTNDYWSFAASVFFAVVGILLSLLIHTAKRDVNSPRTPIPFAWDFLLWDNFPRLFLGVLLVFIGLRFTEDLIGIKPTQFTALIIGASFDNLAKFIQNKLIKT